MRYADRAQAGRALARSLEHLRGRNPIVLGLPRGGVPVAEAVAHAMDADVDILLVRKLGVPWQPELAAGAIGEGGVRVLNHSLLRAVGLSESDLKPIALREEAELKRRAAAFRRVKPPAVLEGRTVVIVDDGIATGATVLAAIEVARAKGAVYVAVATPVCAPDSGRRVAASADEFVAPYQPHDMSGVGAAYRDFHQLSDSEVVKLLQKF
ncbi:phosphoribosyltransferase [Smaragdicoccus niigatensis]|uniref:phosphoribosyltransferase n=1 Tax=Smaragdicoccus niigatensis TaxID=359359 RepID=UPI000372200A|nr:phosphoribosyltransferase family protein [Smaragdicoccus niigatensis]